MQVDVRVMLKNDAGESFSGIGIIRLLKGIEQHCSISAAAREMGLSYPKALRIIGNLERGIGYPIVARRKGGSERGGAELTPIGRRFLQRYDKMQDKIRSFAENTFKKIFAKPLADKEPA